MQNKKLTRREFSKLTTLSALGWSAIPSLAVSRDRLKKIRIAQIGTTHSHAEEKYQTLIKLDNIFDVVGIVESNPLYLEKARKKEEFKNANWISEQQLYDIKDLQALLIETDYNDLMPTALKYVERDLQLHIDKPPGNSMADLKSVFDYAKRQNSVVQMGYMLRYNEAFKFCLGMVKQGVLGKISQVDGVISKKIQAKRRESLSKSYGGGMMLLGCHLIDMLVALCGKPESVQSFRKQTSRDKDLLFDNELSVFSYPGITATIRSSLIEVGGMQRRQFVVVGENGTIEIKPLEPAQVQMTLEKSFGKYKAGRHLIELPKMHGRYDEQLTDFALQINNKKSPEFSREHDLIVHETLLKACEVI